MELRSTLIKKRKYDQINDQISHISIQLKNFFNDCEKGNEEKVVNYFKTHKSIKYTDILQSFKLVVEQNNVSLLSKLCDILQDRLGYFIVYRNLLTKNAKLAAQYLYFDIVKSLIAKGAYKQDLLWHSYAIKNIKLQKIVIQL